MLRRLLISFLLVAFSASLAVAQEAVGTPESVKSEAAKSDEQTINAIRETMEERAASRAQTPEPSVDWRKTGPEQVESSGLRMLKGLALCTGLFFVGIHFYKKFGGQVMPAGKERRLRVLERLSISPRTALVLMEVDGKPVLLTVGSESVSHIPMTEPSNRDEFCESLDEECAEELKASGS